MIYKIKKSNEKPGSPPMNSWQTIKFEDLISANIIEVLSY